MAGQGAEPTSPDQVYAAPNVAQSDAESTLSDPTTTDTQRTAALTTLGRSAYYDNRIDDAISYLQQAHALATDPALLADITLTLSPALSKDGRSVEALALLDMDPNGLTPEQHGKAHNQRGIIFVELGRLPEAIDAFADAAEELRSCGDLAGEGRSLINMAAAASELGELEQAEAWYEQAWKLTTETDQAVMNAMIEGNLGYVASRKGDFGSALSWYNRARNSFSTLGGVDLLVAVLEADHATTLLDLGLNNDALVAAEYARQSSASGSNRMLEVQALLLRGEAQLRLRHYRDADQTLLAARHSAQELDLTPWVLRCDYLLSVLRTSEADSPRALDLGHVLLLARGLHGAGWYRECLRVIVLGIRKALDQDNSSDVGELLEFSSAVDTTLMDPIDLAYADALRAFMIRDVVGVETALHRGFAEVDRQQQLLGSAELQVRLGHRIHGLRSLALRAPLHDHDPGAAVMARERGRLIRARSSRAAEPIRVRLRDARVGLQEARLAGNPTEEIENRLSDLEAELATELGPLTSTRTSTINPSALCDIPGDTTVIRFIHHRGALHAVRADDELTLVGLGPTSPIESGVRAQRTALRRMATSAGGQTSSRADGANQRLDDLLLAPLDISPAAQVIIIPDAPVAGLSWGALPSLTDRDVVVAPHAPAAIRSAALELETIGLVGGGRLEHADAELEGVAEWWSALSPTVHREASIDDAVRVLLTHDLVHVAAHGEFRPENPFLSSIEFTDGSLNLLDFEQLDSLPVIMILASCDTAVSAGIGAELVGTTEVLLSLGVEIVVAPNVVVDDAASQRLVLDFHQGLAAGSSPAAALRHARHLALDRNLTADVAAAHAFQIHGGASSLNPVDISHV